MQTSQNTWNRILLPMYIYGKELQINNNNVWNDCDIQRWYLLITLSRSKSKTSYFNSLHLHRIRYWTQQCNNGVFRMLLSLFQSPRICAILFCSLCFLFIVVAMWKKTITKQRHWPQIMHDNNKKNIMYENTTALN